MLSEEQIDSRIREMLKERWAQLENVNSVRGDEVKLVSREFFVMAFITEFGLNSSETSLEYTDRVAKVWQEILKDESFLKFTSGGFLLPA